MSPQLFEVSPRVFLGDIEATSDPQSLRAHGITAVLTCGSFHPPWCSSRDRVPHPSVPCHPPSPSPGVTSVLSRPLRQTGVARISCSASAAEEGLKDGHSSTSGDGVVFADSDYCRAQDARSHRDALHFTTCASSQICLGDRSRASPPQGTSTADPSASPCFLGIDEAVGEAGTGQHAGEREEGQPRRGPTSKGFERDSSTYRVDIEHLQLDIRDTEDEPLLEYLPTAIDFIRRSTATATIPRGPADSEGMFGTSNRGPPGAGGDTGPAREERRQQQSDEKDAGLDSGSPVSGTQPGRVLVHWCVCWTNTRQQLLPPSQALGVCSKRSS